VAARNHAWGGCRTVDPQTPTSNTKCLAPQHYPYPHNGLFYFSTSWLWRRAQTAHNAACASTLMFLATAPQLGKRSRSLPRPAALASSLRLEAPLAGWPLSRRVASPNNLKHTRLQCMFVKRFPLFAGLTNPGRDTGALSTLSSICSFT
jgi:hypothetical protein